MPPSYLSQGQTRQDGISRDLKVPAKVEIVRASDGENPLDSQEMRKRLDLLMQWRRQARIAQADNRTEMATDCDFYDGIQYSEEDLNALAERNQPPLVFNVTKNTINWILGTERKTRIDYRVLPRKKKGAAGAKAKTKLLKFIQDMSKGEFERSQAFSDAVKAGLGWLEVAVRGNADCPIFMRAESWRNMWFDHLGRSLDGSDWRFVFREKWVDLDIAQGLFPDREQALRVLADGVNSLHPYIPEDIVTSDNASEFDLDSDLDSLFGGRTSGVRERVKLIEGWYRMPAQVKVMHARGDDTPYGALSGSIFRPENADHQYLVRGDYFSLTDTRRMVVRSAIFAGATYLQDILTPYNHNQFPFIPHFCYRRQRDGMPYGMIRDIRDPQSDLNKRRSRALFILSSNQTIYEEGAINDPIKFYEESNRPDGMMMVNKGALVSGTVKRERDQQLAMEHVELAREDERFVESVSGVTPENKGTVRKDLSGKAIEAIQLQGHTTSGVVFDNYYYAFRAVGEILVSLEEQFFDQEDEYRITGDQQKDEFIRINEDKGDGRIENAIQESKADFVVSKQDFRETLRLNMLQMLSELVQSLAQSGMPQVALALVDLVIDMMDDLPNKDEAVARIRKISGQQSPDDELTPEEKAEREQEKQAAGQEQQALKALQMAMAKAELAVKQAEASSKGTQAMKNEVEAQMKRLEGFLKALEVAGTVQVSPQLVEAADTLIEEASGEREITDQSGGR